MVRSRPALQPAAGILCGCLFFMQFGKTAVSVLIAFAILAVLLCPVINIRQKPVHSKAGEDVTRPARRRSSALKRMRVRLALFAVCCLTGAARTYQSRMLFEEIRQTYPAGSECRLAGQIVSLEESGEQMICIMKVQLHGQGPHFYVRADAEAAAADGDPLLFGYADTAAEAGGLVGLGQGHIGQQIMIFGTVREDQIARNEGSFDARRYDESRGIALRVKISKVSLGARKAFEWRDALRRLHERITQVYQRYLPGEESGLLSGLVLGDRAEMDPEAKQLLSDAGLAHILAVSGTHVGILGRRTYRRLKRMRLSRVISGLISGGLLILYCLICGSSISALRATVMFLIYLTAEAVGESYDAASAAAWCGAAFLLIRPQVLYSAGFLLSFGAAFAICFFCEPLQKKMQKKEWPRLLSPVVFAGAIQLSMLPLTLQLFYEIPVYASLVNLLVLPLVSPLLAAGLAGGLLGAGCLTFLSFIPRAMDLILRGLFFLCHCILYLMEAAAGRSLSLPYSRFAAGAPGWLLAAAFWFFLYLAIHKSAVVRWILNRQKNAAAQRALPKQAVRVDHGERRNFRTGTGLRGKLSVRQRMNTRKGLQNQVFLPVHSICLVLLFFMLFGRQFGSPKAVMLDVGQGTGIFLSDGRRTQIMIDGGSTSNKKVGTYTIEPFLLWSGVSGIDYWLISHTDADHVSGLLELLEQGYPIGSIVLPAAIQEMDSSVIEQIQRLAAKNKTEVICMFPQDQILVRHPKRGFRITCLGPPEDSAFTGANDNSLILLLEWDGMRMFFGGDISAETEHALVLEQESLEQDVLEKTGSEQEGSGQSGSKREMTEQEIPRRSAAAVSEWTDIQVYIANHHGSNGSSSEELLAAIKPEIALISCGVNNRYGHPGRETLSRLETAGISWLCTQDTGQITLRRSRNGSCIIEPYLPQRPPVPGS